MTDESTLQTTARKEEEVLRLLITDTVASWVFPLSLGDALVGRGAECHVRLSDSMASRTHVKIRVDEHRDVFVADLGSANGTSLNGAPLVDVAPFTSGDVLRIGQSTIYLYLGNPADGQRLTSLTELRRRVITEIERSIRNDRPCALLEVRLATPLSSSVLETLVSMLRPFDSLAEVSRTHLLVLLPDLRVDSAQLPAERMLDRLEAAGASGRIGVATAPLDAVDADALLDAARVAADLAEPGGLAFPAERLRKIEARGEHVLVGDPDVARAFALVERLAPTEISVLVTGETGAGKEFAARLLHDRSNRRDGPFVAVNCAAIAPGVAEAELFGNARGAFTGAIQARAGYVESADGGTLFLDEVAELTAAVQANLLRVLETKTVLRIGEVVPRNVDLRLVAATHRDLESEVRAGRFREDLYFRVVGAQVVLPPLRQRRMEVLPLARAFLRAASGANAPPGLSAGVQGRLMQYAWPGNVRELRNAMSYVAGTCVGPLVMPEHLPPRIAAAAAEGATVASFRPLSEEVRDLEIRRISEALDASGWNKTQAAALIGMSVRTLSHKIKQYGIMKDDAPRT